MPEINVTFDSSTASVNSWDGASLKEVQPKGDVYSIAKASELAWVAAQVKAGNNFSGKTIRLLSNINLQNKLWTPIGDDEHRFDGIFDGQANTISNIYVEGATYAGLFGVTDTNSKIIKLGTKGACRIVNEAEVYGGTLAGVNHGIIDDCFNACRITVETNTEKIAAIGGLTGVNFRMISNCFNEGSVSATNSNAQLGGLTGVNHGLIEDCYNEGSLASQVAITNSTLTRVCNYAGGIASSVHGHSRNCYNEGAVEISLKAANTDYAELFAGGICGWNDGTLHDCYNLQEVKAAIDFASENEILTLNAYAGGINGWNAGTVEKCYNESKVHAKARLRPPGSLEEAYAGGIVGINHGKITNSRNTGSAYADASLSRNVHTHNISGQNEGSIIDSF